ncbi:MAG: hypothetical protein ABII03_00555 [Nanoarchaeota archaeon]
MTDKYNSKELRKRTEEIFKNYEPLTEKKEDLLEPEIFEGELPKLLSFTDIKILKPNYSLKY